jgi:hypothetical protein
MKKQVLFLLLALCLIAVPLWAQNGNSDREQAQHAYFHAKAIKAEFSGSAIPLANPFTGPFPVLVNFEGDGNRGRVSGQTMFLYAPLSFGPDGKAIIDVLEGQTSCRLDINGEVLLGVFDPGVAGWMQITDPSTGSIVSEQNWTGRIVGGTGAFAGKKGRIKASAKTLGVLFTAPGIPGNAVLMTWSGALEIDLEK